MIRDDSSVGIRTLIRECWSALDGQRGRVVTFMVLFVVAYALELALPWAIGFSIDAFVRHGTSDIAFKHAVYGMVAYSILRIVSSAAHHVARYLQTTTAYVARMRVLQTTFEALLGRTLSWHLAAHSGDHLSGLNRAARAAESAIGTYLWQVIEGLVKVAIATAALFALDGVIAVNVLVLSTFTIAAIMFFNGRRIRDLRQANRFENRMSRLCVDACTNIVTVKTQSLEAAAGTNLMRQVPDGATLIGRVARLNELKWGSIGCGYAAVISSSLLLYLWRAKNAHVAVDVTAVYVLMSYLDKIFACISSFTSYFGGIVEAATAFEDAVAIRSYERVESPLEAAPIAGPIRISALRYSYPGSAGTGVRAADLEIRPGERIALVGPSGGGKSTLLKLLGGLVEADHADIQIGGRNGENGSLRARALLIPQEPEIFSDTILYNLTFGMPVPADRLQQVIEACQLDGFLAKQPARLGTILAEGGLNMSGGEKQRLALARGLLRADARDLLLLDEPTSSCDPATELDVVSCVFEAFRGKTIMMSCHRWSLLPLFDRVLYIEDGRVVVDASAVDFSKDTEHFVRNVTILPRGPVAAVAPDRRSA